MFAPFTGLLFDPATVPVIGDATSPPYDVISESERRELLARSPYNVVRLLLAEDDDPSYDLAAELLAAWRSDGTLTPDPDARFYVYEMDYAAPGGERRTARGVLGALDLVELGDRVLPHEETMAKHRADRLAVLSATQANVDPIIALSSSPDLAALLEPTAPPRLDFTTPDGVTHRLSDVADPEAIAAITAAVADHPVAIADGHHRYTTALGYRRDREAAGDAAGGWTSIMTLMAPAEGSGLTVGPYHRVFTDFPFTVDAVASSFEVEPGRGNLGAGELGVVAGGGEAWTLRPAAEALEPLPAPWREASPAVAREVLYPLLGVSEDHAEYVADADAAIAAAPEGGAALLVAPVTEHAIAEAGEMGLRFPQKTTYFIPKPRAGLVIRAFG
jgi:uncharacterized protein (DUF1015 family)